MSVSSFVIHELLPVPLGDAIDFKSFDGVEYKFGAPIAADEKAYRKHKMRRQREKPEVKAKEAERRNDPIQKARAIELVKAYRVAHPDYKSDCDAIDYHRPFLIIDSEGCRDKSKRATIIYESNASYARRIEEAAERGLPKPKRQGVKYPVHNSFLWAAGYWQRTRPGTGKGPGADKLHHSGTEGADCDKGATQVEFDYLERRDKSNIPVREKLHWLTELQFKFPHVIPASFSFGYDAAQILAGVPLKLRKEICRNQYEDDEGNPHEVPPSSYKHFWTPKKERLSHFGGGDEHYGKNTQQGFGIAYLKGKFLSVCKIRWDDTDKKVKIFDQITIYDVYSFYGMGLVKVLKSLVDQGYVTEEEYQTIKKNKEHRDDFDDDKLTYDKIKEYCTLELSTTSRALIVLRDGFDAMGIRLSRWTGPGSAAGALLRKNRVPQDHYPAKGAVDEINGEWHKVEGANPLLHEKPYVAGNRYQDAAHHAFFAGHIELLQQGFHPGWLDSYDVISAYPAGCIGLSSMRDGRWIEHGALRHLPKPIDDFDRLSLFKVRVRLKQGVMKNFLINGKKVKQPSPFMFFPLPMRVADHYPGLGKGSILFPCDVIGWCCRDDIAALFAWLEKFDPKMKESRVEFYEIFEFVPDNNIKPFAFVADLFRQRAEIKARIKATGIYDPLEQNIKVTICSLYGKMGEKVGTRGEPPMCANPHYAGAITAWCRRKLMEACLKDPDAIVTLATDGIISKRPLDLDVGTGLGQWEHCRVFEALFLQSGVNFYLKDETDDDKRFINRLRGSSRKSIDGPELRKEIIEGTMQGWSTPIDELPDGRYVINQIQGKQPAIPLIQKSCVTAGNSVRSSTWDRLCGRFASETRMLNIHTMGTKRGLGLDPENYETVRNADGSLRLARRCTQLVPSESRINPHPHIMSAPLYPKWIQKAPDMPDDPEESDGVFQELHEQAELFEGVRGHE